MNVYDALDSIPFSVTFREDTSGSFVAIELKDYAANDSLNGSNNGSGQARAKVTFKCVCESVADKAAGAPATSNGEPIDTFMDCKATGGTESVYTIDGIDSGVGLYKAVAIYDGSAAGNGASPFVKVETFQFEVTDKKV